MRSCTTPFSHLLYHKQRKAGWWPRNKPTTTTTTTQQQQHNNNRNKPTQTVHCGCNPSVHRVAWQRRPFLILSLLQWQQAPQQHYAYLVQSLALPHKPVVLRLQAGNLLFVHLQLWPAGKVTTSLRESPNQKCYNTSINRWNEVSSLWNKTKSRISNVTSRCTGYHCVIQMYWHDTQLYRHDIQ